MVKRLRGSRSPYLRDWFGHRGGLLNFFDNLLECLAETSVQGADHAAAIAKVVVTLGAISPLALPVGVEDRDLLAVRAGHGRGFEDSAAGAGGQVGSLSDLVGESGTCTIVYEQVTFVRALRV